MKKTIRENRYFLLFIVLFAYVQSIYTRISVRGQINAYTFTPEAAIGSLFAAVVLFLVILFFIRKWQHSDTFSTKELLKIFGTSILAYIIIIQATGFLIAFIFDNIERNFNQHTFFVSLISQFLNAFIYGSFFLAYYYFKKDKKHQEQVTDYHKALSESRINQLKTQLNPHFLFNNLNVLDQLIEEDKHKASEFLNEFAEIYRYVLQALDKDLINLNEEVNFAQQYFKLIQHKYGEAYQLSIENSNANGFIVPLSLQLLIENAVQHNLGTERKPIFIRINIGESVTVTNNTNLKRTLKTTSGRALRNLQEQYELLSTETMVVEQKDDIFSVRIPIISLEK